MERRLTGLDGSNYKSLLFDGSFVKECIHLGQSALGYLLSLFLFFKFFLLHNLLYLCLFTLYLEGFLNHYVVGLSI